MANDDVDQAAITTLRTLAIDAIEAAGSGYPGTAMAMAPVLYTLFTEHLRYDPDDPQWPNRDRFVLSVGHASILLYAMLHVAEVKQAAGDDELAISLEDLRNYRQGGSKATGHPEYGVTTGVETTTGPLGQGIATSVGMAMAQRWTAATFDPEGQGVFNHEVIALCGDGDMMEGISYEAASLAGHHQLSQLCWIYDDNAISIEGDTDITFTEDVAGRFTALGWQVRHVDDANDRASLKVALDQFRNETSRPTLIIVKSTIGWGSPNRAGTQMMHGIPLGADEAAATKESYGWPADSDFLVPDEVRTHVNNTMCARGREARADWDDRWASFRADHPDRADALDKMAARELPQGWDADLPSWDPDATGIATKDASGQIINAVAPNIPWLLGGAADTGLPSGTFMWFPEAGSFQPSTPTGRNLHFGVREHAMAAVANGITLSGLRVYDAAYLIFTDYARGALRLSALMGLPVVHVFTHDSFQIGADGPTHQPVEQLVSYRAIPNLTVIRPCDANDTTEAWKLALERADGPTILALSVQPLPILDRSLVSSAEGLRRGGYVLSDPPDGEIQGVLIATGAEVHLALAAQQLLADQGVGVRVVNLASWEIFDTEPQAYRDSVLPPSITARVAIEEAATIGWHRYVGDQGSVLGFDTFGLSAPIPKLQERFGFTADHVAAEMSALL